MSHSGRFLASRLSTNLAAGLSRRDGTMDMGWPVYVQYTDLVRLALYFCIAWHSIYYDQATHPSELASSRQAEQQQKF